MFSKASVIYSALILNTLLTQTQGSSFYTNMMRNIQRVSEATAIIIRQWCQNRNFSNKQRKF